MEPLQKEIRNKATYISEISARSLQSGSPSWGLRLWSSFYLHPVVLIFLRFFIEPSCQDLKGKIDLICGLHFVEVTFMAEY